MAGLLAGLLVQEGDMTLKQATRLGLLVARERVDSLRRAATEKPAFEALLAEARREEVTRA